MSKRKKTTSNRRSYNQRNYRMRRLKRRVKSLFVVLILVVLALVVLRKVFNHEEVGEDVWKPFYNVSYLDHDHYGHKTYESEEYTSKFGVDISFHQQKLDYQALKDGGVEFVYLRLGYRGYSKGQVYVDETFAYNMEQARLHQIPVGIYFFSQANTEQEAIEEADFVLDHIQKEDVTYPIAFDMETIEGKDRISHLDYQEKTKITLAFVERIQQAGYKTLVYGNPYWFSSEVDLDQILEKSEIWLSSYGVTLPMEDYPYEMWQYNEQGRIDGIDVPLDFNMMFIKKPTKVEG